MAEGTDEDRNHNALVDRQLQGRMYLELPVQRGRIPQGMIDTANRLDIKIRDIMGKVYNP